MSHHLSPPTDGSGGSVATTLDASGHSGASGTGVGILVSGRQRTVDRERALAALAQRQDGVATRAQLAASGWTPARVDSQVASGRFRALHRGVYALAPGPLSNRSLARAALLSVGDGAVLSHRWAAAFWGFSPPPSGTVEVTIKSRSGSRRSDLRVHRVLRLDDRDVQRHRGLRVTTPERTILDVAAREPPGQIERLIDDAVIAKVTTVESLGAVAERYGPRPGAPLVRRLLAESNGPKRSDAEREFLRFWRRTELPPYEANAPLLGFTVDAFWRDHAVVVEIDSRRFHDDVPGRREQDRLRSSRLTAAGFVVIRISYRRLMDHPVAVAAELGQVLGRSPV